MEPLQPSSLRIRASWDGDINRAANVCVTVEVETKPNSRLLLLNRVKNTGLSHSMVWRIRSLGQEVPAVDVTDSKSILAHQVDYIPPSPPRKLFASSRGYQDEYGIQEKPDSFFQDWLSSHDTKETLDDQTSTSSEPKQEDATEETAQETAFDTVEAESPLDALCVDEASEISLGEQNLDRWIDMNQSIEQYFDDSFLDLPPSPTPSSQDLIPWASTKEIMDRLKAEEERDPLSFSSEVIVAPPPRDPGIVHQDGQMFLDFPGSVEAKIYRVDLHFLKYVREGQNNWLELDLSQIGMACPEVQGLFVLEMPWECEFSTPDLSDKQAANGHLEYQFSPQYLRAIAFRRREDRDCTTVSSNASNVEPHTSIESEPEDSTLNTQSSQQQISGEPLQPTDEIEFIKPTMPSSQAGRPRRTTTSISRDFFHQFLVFVFFAMVAVFTATGGPPEAIATPANTWSTLRGVASDMRRQGSSIQTMVMETVRDAQLLHGWHVYRALWMDALTNEEPDVSIKKSAICLPIDVMMQELAAVCLATGDIDMVIQDSATASHLTGNVTVFEESNRAGSSTGDNMLFQYSATVGDIGVLTQGSTAAGFPTEDTDTYEILATSTVVFSAENASISTEETGDGYWGTWSLIGRNFLSRIGCSTSAHCIMVAAAEDDDPQWEVFERYRCDAKNS
ncbi:uncharacterized protein TRUGW13939_02828 [Talaromyces rugulosus]|uniref:Uncharacterized protein n=1 Tax=Talaromyces rugulosus TaxID=121627 RepID=A0A7H8QP37_TALRU|nr:uncharacterized protein TRUGW13939_02828 [Talaromyces rugulosus]QKX55730.1 hypothetical protein TRUGW13939_02828 [Talaromyces rugulosus]